MEVKEKRHPVVDVHAHSIDLGCVSRMQALHPEHAPHLIEQADGIHLEWKSGRVRGPLAPGIYSVEQRLADMDLAGVDLQLLSVPPFMFHYGWPGDVSLDFARMQNDAMIETSLAHPDRLHVLGTLPLHDPAASLLEIDRIAAFPLVRGVEISSNVEGRNLDDPSLEPVWAALETARLAVVVHPSAVAGADRMTRYHLSNLVGNPTDSTIAIASLIFGGVVSRHPELRFCFVHGGGFAPYQIGRWDHGWRCRPEAQVSLTRPPSEEFATLFIDSLTLDQLSLQFLGARMGWDHVLLGSDYPFDMAEPRPVDRIMELDLPSRDRDAVLGSNTIGFLRPMPSSP